MRLRDKLLRFGQCWIEQNPWYLAPLSGLYALAVRVRNRLYDSGCLPIVKVPCVVVSIGNIVAGGTGKTPFVHLLAKRFAHRKVAILSRGYGAMPDEALLLARRLPNVAVYVGRDRVALAREAAKSADLILLDDGFQHRRLYRDLDLVLLQEREVHYLPWGFLRDSPNRLSHADALFSLGKELRLDVKRILDLGGREIPSIRGEEVFLFSAIAHPERFKKSVESLGARVVGELRLADHAEIDLSKLPKMRRLLCTEKDAVKLPPTDLPIYFLEMEMEVVQEIERFEKVIERIDQKIDNRRNL